MNKMRVIRWVALVLGIFLAPLLALVLLLPMIVDSQAVKAKASAYVAEKTDGLARFAKIDLFWFPRPGVVIRDAAISFDQQIEGKIKQLRLYPSLRDLLTGNLTFTRITADEAAWIVRLPARDQEAFNLDAVEAQIRAGVEGLVSAFPGVNLRLSNGAADIAIGGRQSLMITDIDASLGVALDKLAFSVSAVSNIAERLHFTGEMAPNSLASEAQLSVDKLVLRKAVEFFSPDSAGWVDDGTATLSVKVKAAGLKRFNAEVAGSLPSLTLARGNRKALIESKGFKVNVTGDEKMFRVAIESLPLVSPRLKAAGEIVFDRASSSFSVKLTGHDLDAGMIRKSALTLVDDVAGARDVFSYVLGGTIPEIHLETRGRSLAEAFDIQRVSVTASMRDGKIFVPGPDLALDNANGAVLISAAVLECKKCSATLGKSQGRDGSLRVGLASPSAPFHLDVRVETDAKELQSLLARYVPDATFRKELARFRDVAGSLSGRLVLGETLDAISAKVLAVEPALTASYEPVPYPISLRGGRLNYDDGKIEAESLAGAVGHSSFSGLTGSLRTQRAGQLDIKSASVQLDLEQTELLLRKAKTLQGHFGPKDSARGKIDFAAISLSGPLNDPSRWDFTGRGKVEGVLVKHALLPGPLALAQGTFDVAHERLTFGDAKVQMLDASITGGGVVEHWRKAPFHVEATVSGSAGARMMEWVKRQTEIPAAYMPRSPLDFSSGRMSWRGDGDFSFNGKLTVAHGPRISVDMAGNPRSLTIKELLIDDGGQSARATFELERDKWSLGFSGSLNKRTLDRIFLTAPSSAGLLQGNFAASASRKAPFRLSARGTLAAKDLVLPLKGEHAVIDRIIVQGDHAGLNIRSADLRWRGSHISFSGKLTTLREALQVDMDVAADRMAWDEFSAVFGRGDGQENKADMQLPSLEGVIRLKAANFAVGGLSWSPLQVTAGLTANGVTGEVQNSTVCGIRTTGSFAVHNNNQIDLDARLSAKDGALQSTSRCLSLGNFDVTGTYSLDARLQGRASAERLAQSLSGEFNIVARDGRFIHAKALGATFDYLNDTGDFKVAFPDLDKEAFPYRLVSAKGTVERQSIFAQEIIIEASPYTITAQATADLERNTIDGKGLVTVVLPAANIIKSIPLIGSILSASMVGIPVEVSGAIDKPRVSYLSPAALGAELVNIPLRILKAPLDALQIFTPFLPGSEQK